MGEHRVSSDRDIRSHYGVTDKQISRSNGRVFAGLSRRDLERNMVGHRCSRTEVVYEGDVHCAATGLVHRYRSAGNRTTLVAEEYRCMPMRGATRIAAIGNLRKVKSLLGE